MTNPQKETAFTTKIRSCDIVRTPDGEAQVILLNKYKATVRFLDTGIKKSYDYADCIDPRRPTV